MRKLIFLSVAIIGLLILLSCGSTDSKTNYQVSITASPSEGGTVSPTGGEYEEGSSVDISAQPLEEWRFMRWEGGYQGTSSTATITVDSDKNIKGIFAKKEYELTVNTEGEGTVDESVLQTTSTADYESGTIVELTANPSEGWKFVEWQGDVTRNENPTQITVDEAKQVTAIFEKRSYELTVNTEGEGTVDESVVQTTSTADYESGTIVELTANPAEGWKFVKWQGDITSTENPTQITVDEAKEVIAVFENESFAVNINTEGEGSVTKNPDQENYIFQSSLELEAIPTTGYQFVEWRGDIESTENPVTVTVDTDPSFTAVFEKENYSLTINTEGEGTVTKEPNQTEYAYNSTVNLTANPATGWEFVKWKGDLTGNKRQTQITIDSSKEVTAVFEKKSFKLTVNTKGNGSVSKNPDQNQYKYQTTVSLSAEPEQGWKFVEFKGDISSTSKTTEITIDQAKEVTAVFEKAFYIGKNGVTIKCPEANFGDKGTINGFTYTKRTAKQITASNVTTTCTSGIKDMSRLFEGAKFFNGDISSWDVSNATDMSYMFNGTQSFNGDISSWDVSKVKNMSYMFWNAESFNSDISDWDVDNVNDMGYMFAGATSFNQPIGIWKNSNVTNMEGMFYAATSFNQDISSWDVSSVSSMNSMFYNAPSFNQDLNKWDVSAVTNMAHMFSFASSFNGNISNWNVSRVKKMNELFYDASSFNQDISGWCVSTIDNEPLRFSAGSPLPEAHKPIWGTCPSK